jgi:putative flavoprotein involved in K+ transport
MRKTTTVIIGAGHAGLAFSKHLAARSVDHVILERGEVANSWRKERWDSLRLLTPNWQSRLPGYAYSGDDPDGYMDMEQVIKFIQDFSESFSAPIENHTTVLSVRSVEDGYAVVTNRGEWRCRKLVVASGACNIANIPKLANELPRTIKSVSAMQYKSPDQLEEGGVMVVGASASGIQFAREIQASGRQVTLCVGEHVRLPRMYRGKDIKWWMDATGLMDMPVSEVDDIKRVRRVPSLQLIGSPEKSTLDINTLSNLGVDIVGRLVGLRDEKALFSGSLANQCALADLKMNRLLDTIDEWVIESGLTDSVPGRHRFNNTKVSEEPKLFMNLEKQGIRTIIWATGYRPDYSWLHVPVLDRKGQIIHDNGIVNAPGMYVMGLPFLRRRKSSFIDGANDDARELATHLYSQLFKAAA